MKILRLHPSDALRTFRGGTQKTGMSDGDIELRIRFAFNTACSPMGAIANMRVQSLDERTIVGGFTLYGHDGHLGQVKWIFNTCITPSYRCFI